MPQRGAAPRATGLPHGQLVVGVTGFQRLRSGHERDAVTRHPQDSLQDAGALLREGIHVAAAPAPVPRLQRLVAHDPGPAVQPLQADLAGPAAGALEGQAAHLPAGQHAVGVQQAQDLQLLGPYVVSPHQTSERGGWGLTVPRNETRIFVATSSDSEILISFG